MTYAEYKKLADESIKQLVEIGYPEVLSNKYNFVWNTRAKKRLGRCTPLGNHHYEIQLNKLYADTNPKGARNTIMHELIHSIKICRHHDHNWQRIASIVNRKFGYSIHTTSNPGVEYNMAAYGTEKRVNQVNYLLQCLGCGRLIKRTKMSAAVQHPERYRCQCGGKLERVK